MSLLTRVVASGCRWATGKKGMFRGQPNVAYASVFADGRAKVYADTDTALNELVELCSEADIVGVDTEFTGFPLYTPKVELIQVSTPSVVGCLDTAAFSEDALRDALRVLHEKELLVHAATMDIQILRSFGLEPSRIFDTQIAYAFLDCGMRIGLGPLVESLTGLVLEKGESISDWRKRPLSESQVSYALNDVAHLHTLQELLTEKMEVAGRLNWFREEMDSLLTPPSEPDELTLWKTIRRNRKLKNSPQSLAVLSHLAAWRQAAAKEADLSPNLLMRDDILVALAGSPPNTLADLGNFQGVKPATIKYHGATILYTVSQGLEAEPIEPPEEWLMSSDDEVRQHMLRKLCESVMLSVSLEMQIAPFMLCPEQSISEFAAAAPGEEVWGDGAVLLHGWRRDAVGLQLLKVKGGALAPRWAGTKIAFEDTLVSSRNDVPG